MLDKYRNKEGFIDLNNTPYTADISERFKLIIDGVGYYFKYTTPEMLYNELIAEELAKKLNIPCAHYDIGKVNERYIVLSEDFIKEGYTFTPMSAIIKERKNNNLEVVWDHLMKIYDDYDLVAKLMDQIVDIFLFDVVSANSDRHFHNYGILSNEKETNITPVFDNERILDVSRCIEEQRYNLGVDYASDMFKSPKNTLNKFLAYSDKSYTQRLKNMLWAITPESVDDILTKVEQKIKTKLPETTKKAVKEKFQKNLQMIEKSIKYAESKQL